MPALTWSQKPTLDASLTHHAKMRAVTVNDYGRTPILSDHALPAGIAPRSPNAD
ncbi:hypothetical protein [Streptomyces sp. NPDC096132]|uniref:hypothetical protein n=1 Tax=Streptomyces sp. NPDC096132 TaxID=3366075 RepID=UPI00380A9FBE